MNETALKDRLKAIARDKAITFNKVWKQLLLERFLVRLSNSPYQENFTFKGGLLLAQYITINRETIDIDFLMTKIRSETRKVEVAIRDIATIDLKDGFSFAWFAVEELNQPHMEYTGYRVTLDAKFGKMRDKIQVDIGIGDDVEPVEMAFSPFEYNGKPIFAGEISLRVYPREAIFAEKLETIISKGVINSRMKDYHDVLVMISEPNFLDIQTLNDSIHATFKRRGTAKSLVIHFDPPGIQILQKLWANHLRGLGIFKTRLAFPDQISDVISHINHWLKLNGLI